MAGMLHTTPGPGFAGHLSIFQFENCDGVNPATVCGQAAVATVLANYNRIEKGIAGLRKIEKAYPADVLSGVFGTSAGRVERALAAEGLSYHHVYGRAGLVGAMRGGRAAIALIQNAPGLGGIGQGAHWFVIFGCDSNGVHVTNYSPQIVVDWPTFEGMWSAPVAVADGMGNRVIVC